ncbi:hypothetical protein [Streptomyces sp. NPDC054834]
MHGHNGDSRDRWEQQLLQPGQHLVLGRRIQSVSSAASPFHRPQARFIGRKFTVQLSGDTLLADGDWSLTAGPLLLRWYGRSANPKRLVMLGGERICVAASPGRRVSQTRASDFRTVAVFTAEQASAEGDAGRLRGFATFRLRFHDGSWLELGRLAEPEDADHFLRTVDG